jgi:hypothetical protein
VDGNEPFQVLATNIIPAAAAMRRTAVARNPQDLQAITPNFVPVSRGWVEETNTVTFTNRPDLIIGMEFQEGSQWYRVADQTNVVTTTPDGQTVSRIDALAVPLIWEPSFIPTPPDGLPQAIEVNLAATDLGTMANRDLLDSPSFLIRNPGFYHFRVTLFPAP